MTKKYKVVGIGNAVVDVITTADDSFLELMGIEKGIMQLVEKERAEVLYAAMQDRKQAAGGSVANTIAGIGNLGLTTGFVGRVHEDALGHFYADAMEMDGTRFVNPPVPGGELPTSRSMIFVSPDGERSMNTYLAFRPSLGRTTWIPRSRPTPRSCFWKAIFSTRTKGKTRSSPWLVPVARAAVRLASRFPTRSASNVTAPTS